MLHKVANHLGETFINGGRSPASARGLAAFLGDGCVGITADDDLHGTARQQQSSPLVPALNASLATARSLRRSALALSTVMCANAGDGGVALSGVLKAATSANSTTFDIAELANCENIGSRAGVMLHKDLCDEV